MKKILALISSFLLPVSLQAATLVGEFPKEVTVGDRVELQVQVQPDEEIYTVLADLSFPTDILDVVRVEGEKVWIPLTKETYDAVDEANGVVRKTYGYPGGIATSTPVFSIVFQATAEGGGTISFTSKSNVLTADGKDVFTTAPSVPVTVVAKPVPVAEPVTQAPTPPLFETDEAIVPVQHAVVEPLDVVSNTNTLGRTQAAAAINSLVIPPEAYLIGLLLLFSGIAITGLVMVLRNKRRS